jgi:hypothetical protein
MKLNLTSTHHYFAFLFLNLLTVAFLFTTSFAREKMLELWRKQEKRHTPRHDQKMT